MITKKCQSTVASGCLVTGARKGAPGSERQPPKDAPSQGGHEVLELHDRGSGRKKNLRFLGSQNFITSLPRPPVFATCPSVLLRKQDVRPTTTLKFRKFMTKFLVGVFSSTPTVSHEVSKPHEFTVVEASSLLWR